MSRLAIFVFLWAINSIAVGDADTIIVTFPTFLLCLLNIARIRSPYLTVADMFWFVYLIFFVIGPIQTLSDNYFRKEGPVFGVYFTDAETYSAASIAFLFAVAATIAGFFWSNNRSASPLRIQDCSIDGRMLLPLAGAVVISFAAVVVFSGGLGNLLAARADKDQVALSILRVIALASQLITTFFVVSLAMKHIRNGRMPGFFPVLAVAVSLSLLFVAQNPYNTPRYFLIQSWLPVVLLLLKGRLRVGPFYFACLFGMLVLLPVFSLTSRFGANFSDAIQNIDLAEDFFHLPYVDVFDMLVYEIRYVGDIGFSYGSRTLGALLFFVPRAIWTAKPPLIALQMGEELLAMKVAGTENLSLFFGGEFYADFGLPGVFLLGLLFSWIYLRLLHVRPMLVNGFQLREFILISAIPIVLRGPIGANAPLIFMELIVLAIYLRLFAVRLRHPRARLAGAGS